MESTKAKLTKRSITMIEQLYAMDHEAYGKKIKDMSESEISHIVEKALIGHYTTQMDELIGIVNEITEEDRL